MSWNADQMFTAYNDIHLCFSSHHIVYRWFNANVEKKNKTEQKKRENEKLKWKKISEMLLPNIVNYIVEKRTVLMLWRRTETK